MGSSLGILASIINHTTLNILSNAFTNQNQFELLTRKGIFPSDYMTKLGETNLPSKELLYFKLKDVGISDNYYARAQKV